MLIQIMLDRYIFSSLQRRIYYRNYINKRKLGAKSILSCSTWNIYCGYIAVYYFPGNKLDFIASLRLCFFSSGIAMFHVEHLIVEKRKKYANNLYF